MKLLIKIEKEYDAKILRVQANVRYWEAATIDGKEDEEGDLVPCRKGDCWCPTIDIDQGVITNWTKGTVAKIHYKVRDEGYYELLTQEEFPITSIENDYVPSIMCPEGSGYGDYIIMNIDKDGKIEHWNPNLDDFCSDDED